MNSYQDLNLRPANAIAKYMHIRFVTCSDSERITAYALYQIEDYTTLKLVSPLTYNTILSCQYVAKCRQKYNRLRYQTQ